MMTSDDNAAIEGNGTTSPAVSATELPTSLEPSSSADAVDEADGIMKSVDGPPSSKERRLSPLLGGIKQFSKRRIRRKSQIPSDSVVNTPVVLTQQDVALCQALDMEYDRALEDRQVAWSARYQSVRQSTFLSALFMVLLIFTGTIFFLHQADAYWSISEALLFSIYTITTVGYGHLDMPDTATFQWYVIFYIFLGIAMLTILVAQVYQCVALETSRVAVNAGDATARRHTAMRRWLEARVEEQRQHQPPHTSGDTTILQDAPAPMMMAYELEHPRWDWADVVAFLLKIWDRVLLFLRDNEYGRGLSVVLPFLFLIIIGAAVIGPLEGWTVTESVYFAVVSLTTVGFGDYYPTHNASIWFCCLWLPFSVGFMSLYLSNVAAFYIRLSDRNIARIEGVLRRRLEQAKEKAEQERRAVLRRAMRGQRSPSVDGGSSTDEDFASAETPEEGSPAAKRKKLRIKSTRLSGFNTVPTSDDGMEDSVTAENPLSPASGDTKGQRNGTGVSGHQGSSATVAYRRERILRNSQKHMEFAPKENGESRNPLASMTMSTMKDVLRTVHRNNNLHRGDSVSSQMVDTSVHSGNSQTMSPKVPFPSAGPESEYLSVRSNRTVMHHDSKTVRKKPSFALRALVQERFAEIIATDVAGFHNSIEIKECTLTVKIEALTKTADKWQIPLKARKAFRAVAFEALYFVGEHGLITRGADALFSLTPIEFHQLFSPLLASFDDAETMELWLEHTQALADVDLPPPSEKPPAIPSALSLKAPPIDPHSERRSVPPMIVTVPAQSESDNDLDLPDVV
jgi:Ion channel